MEEKISLPTALVPPATAIPPLIEKKKSFDLDSLGLLLEKNLKWSQIIYEQNRRLNRKLAWSAAAGWLRLVIIAIPIILAIWLAPAFWRSITQTYGNLFTIGGVSLNQISNSEQLPVDKILNILPVGGASAEQLKALLK